MRKIISIVLLFLLTFFSLSTLVAADEIEKNEFAQITLKKVADRAASSRKASGGTLLGLGGGIFVLSATSDNEDAMTVGSVTGGIIGGIGLIILSNRSTEEKEHDQVKSFPVAKRETAATESLAYLSKRAKRERITGAIFNGWIAYQYLTNDPNDPYEDDDFNQYWGLSCAGIAIYQLISPSYNEQAYTKVKEQKAQNLNLSLSTGEFDGVILSGNF